jgi:divalent metal cation (Fe/Co/Zn/Cd) transporter
MGTSAPSPDEVDRAGLVRRGLRLSWLTIAYNSVEALVALGAGIGAGSIALIGFGLDSVVEVSSGVAAQWRLRLDIDVHRRARVELVTHRAVGWSLLLLAAYVAADSARALWTREAPERSPLGVAVLLLSVVVMPLLARAKRRVAVGLGSSALRADAMQTSLCAYLSVIALIGVTLNAMCGWWWADPVAALVLVPLIAKEGLDGVRGRACADCACG